VGVNRKEGIAEASNWVDGGRRTGGEFLSGKGEGKNQEKRGNCKREVKSYQASFAAAKN